MNNDRFLIEEQDLELAKKVCKTIENPEVRNRAVANVLAGNISKKYFTDVEADTESGIHKIATVLNRIEISDIYVKDSYIDVRIYFENNELCVPKIHFEKNILPIAYMFIKLDNSLTEAIVTGFALPQNINTEQDFNGYYPVTEEDLVSYYDVENLIVQNYSEDYPDNFETLVFDYLDNRLENDNDFYKTLLSSKLCRNLLKNAANVQSIFDNISSFDTMITNFEETSLEIDNLTNDESLDNYNLLEDTEEHSLDLEADVINDTLEEFSENLEDFEPVEIDELNLVEDSLDMDNSTTEDSSEIEELTEIGYSEDTKDFYQEENENIEPLDIITESFDDNTEAGNTIPDIISEDDSEIIDITALEEELNYSTNTTPSLETIEDVLNEEKNPEQYDTNLEEVFPEDFLSEDSNENEDVEIPETSIEEQHSNNNDENSSQIEDLFSENIENNEEDLEKELVSNTKNKSSLLPLLGALTIIAAIGYFGYTKFINPVPAEKDSTEPASAIVQTTEPIKAEPMPIETIENIKPTETADEISGVSIPEIEQNLDASILVSNLSVNWEVPAGYVSNNTAKRYFTKMGKIIQLDLKTELLLLSRPPITNKIMLELEFNKNSNQFNVKGITSSSGEKEVDDLILQTVKKALNINLKTNMSIFNNITGNPVLVIRL